MLGIGIDTGGTYTDAVVFDTEAHKVLTAAKSLTTHGDLKQGILASLGKLDQELVRRADYLALSTTLATNACVEGKGGRAKLVLFGVDERTIELTEGVYGLPEISEICFVDCCPERDKGKYREPDWEAFRRTVREDLKEYGSVALVQIYPYYNGGAFEKRAEEIVREETGALCVRGYDLYQELNVQKRGATALLNARLLPVMKDFFDSIDRSLEDMGLDLEVYVMKSDGSIMGKEYAMGRPVDTLLCGPAASICGAVELTGADSGMVIDMGGTTSDIGFVRDGLPVSSSAGVQVGQWKTMVKGVDIDTFALGGDSGVIMSYEELSLDERRVIPLCIAAETWPQIREGMKRLADSHRRFSHISEIFLVGMGMPEHPESYTSREQEIMRLLKDGPLTFSELAGKLGCVPAMLRKKRLEEEGLVMRIGITPTDIMHVYGDYDAFDREFAREGVEWLARQSGRKPEELCQEVYDLVKYRLYSNLSRILIRHQTGMEIRGEDHPAMLRLMEQRYEQCRDGKDPEYLSLIVHPRMNLIGTGAPTGIFLPDMERLFDTESVLPEYSHVANAVGAAAGSILAEYTVRIAPFPPERFRVSGGDDEEVFASYREALQFARSLAEEMALAKARAQGARGDLHADVQAEENFYRQKNDEGSGLLVETKVTGSVRIRI